MSLTDRLRDEHARLAVLKATEVELVDGPDAALQVLGPPIDPVRMRCALGILVRANRHETAANLIRDELPAEEWLDIGPLVLSFQGEVDQALRLVRRADESSDRRITRLARLGLAEGVISRWQKDRGGESPLAGKRWPPSEIELAQMMIDDVLRPWLGLVMANGHIESEPEVSAITCAIFCAFVAGDKPVLEECIEWLVEYVPLPLMVAELCLRGMVRDPKPLVEKLRVHHPGEFDAELLAAMVERDVLELPEKAFDAFIDLSSRAETESERQTICIALFETSGLCQSPRMEKAIEAMERIPTGDSRLVGFLHAFKDIAASDLDAARNRIDIMKDETDPVWWQAKARFYEASNDKGAAGHAWERASELLPRPEIIRQSVRASLDRRSWQDAVRGLERLVEQAPESVNDLEALTGVLISLGDHARALGHLEVLVKLAPSNVEYRVALADCLGRCARASHAIAVLQPVCDSDDPPLEALMLQSSLLKTDGRAREGFRLLERVAADHWNEPGFLLTYMSSAYAAEEDQRGHEASARLMALHSEGQVPPKMLQLCTIEQVLEYGVDNRKRRQALQEAVVEGRMPWLMAEDLMGNPPTWAWYLHTQELSWVSEDRLSCAAYTVYATNGFTVRSSGTGRSLEAIGTPETNVDVVLDLSALVTLHALGRLEATAELFGKVLLPSSYGKLQLEDKTRFGQHQPSQEHDLRIIEGEIARGRIHVVGEGATDLSLIDEHTDDIGHHVYRLQDLAEALRATQRASPGSLEQLRRVAQRPRAANQDHPGLGIGKSLVIELMTLRTLASLPILENVLASFAVHLRPEQREEIAADIRARDAAKSAAESHDKLWESASQLVTRGLAEWVPACPTDVRGVDSGGRHRDDDLPLHLHAISMARKLEKPMIADDRVLQVLMYQHDPTGSCRAFGSDQVVLALLRAGRIGLGDAARDYRRLMQWRYRFLVPTPELLKAWATESIGDLPGDGLLEVASYFHDCLRDPGLHCGLEQCDPALPMAAKLMGEWVSAIVAFLADVWNDLCFSDAAADQLTQWVGEELVPSLPRGLWLHPRGHELIAVEVNAALRTAMVQFAIVRDRNRANRGLRVLSNSLGMNDDAFLATAREALRAIM